jgi:hypothetical protein
VIIIPTIQLRNLFIFCTAWRMCTSLSQWIVVLRIKSHEIYDMSNMLWNESAGK